MTISWHPVFIRFKEIAGSLENAIADGLVAAPGQSVCLGYERWLCTSNNSWRHRITVDSDAQCLSPTVWFLLIFWLKKTKYQNTTDANLLSIIVNLVEGRYHLQVTEVLWSCVCRCWAEQVYLTPLAHRFWKLTLQLLSRYATFLTEVQQSLCRDVYDSS